MQLAALWRFANFTTAMLIAGALLASGHDVRAQAAAPSSAAAANPPISVKVYSRDTVLDAAGLPTSTVHLEEQATNAAAAQQLGQFPLSYSESMSDLNISEAYTLKADGRKLAVTTSAIFSQSPPGSSQDPMFDDMRQKTVVFPNLEAGDTIVLTYVAHGKQAYVPGQYFDTVSFSRSFAYNDAKGSIVAPKSLVLNVEAHDIALEKQDTGATITYRWHYSAPNAEALDTSVLSAFDRSPRLIISSLKSYDEFAHAYAALVAPKIAVTDPIKALADQITAGTSDRRQQAEKIYNWVSQHIRYVGIEFGAGAIIPHDSATVLANGYGDCKDHVVLFSALLKAKDINSEFVLIDYGASYSLPDTPRISAFNHAITWIPEFKMYADTTAGVAPFGVLAFQLYGKPVLHAVASGAAIHQTPILAPGATTLTYTTTAHLDDQGNIVGETKTSATGPFVLALRALGKVLEAGGPDRLATAYLQKQQIPGTAHFAVPPLDMSVPDYTIGSTYSLGPFPTILTGQILGMPAQLEMLERPGDTLMGPLDNLTIKDSDPTPCYSGRAVEDIALDAPAGRKFLRTPADAGFDGAHITYKTHWALAGQTMTLHREVTTKFDAPLCSATVRSEAAKAMAAVREDLQTAVSLAASTSPEQQKLASDMQAAEAAARAGDHDKSIMLLTAALSSTALPANTKWAILDTRGGEYKAQGQYDKAIADYSASIEIDPKQALSYLSRGYAYNAKKDYDRAIADYDKALELTPESEGILAARGIVYFNKQDYDRAIVDFSAAIKLKPDDTSTTNSRGAAYDKKQDYDHAIADYTEAIRLNPGNAEYLSNRGAAYAHKKDYAHAISDYDAALKLDPNIAAAYFNRGVSYNLLQNFDHAIADFGEAIRLEPNYPAAFSIRGEVFLNAKKDYDRAIADYTDAIRLAPDDANLAHRRGLAYAGKQNYDAAITDYGEAIRLKPDFIDAFVNRGNSYLGKRDYDHAIADFSQAIKLKPDDALAFSNRAIAYFNKQDFDHSIADNSEAIRLNPNNPLAYNNRGNDYLRGPKPDYDRAMADLNEAIRQKPDYALAFNNRGDTYFRARDYSHAIADHSEAIRLNANYPEAFVGRGLAYFEEKDSDHAIADYSEAIRLRPNYGPAFANRGNSYGEKKDYDHAIADFTDALRLNPKDVIAFNGRAASYHAKEDYSHAVADYSESLKLKPDDTNVLDRQSTDYFLEKDYDHAIADCDAAIKLKPDDAAAFDDRGVAYAGKQDYDHAITDFNEALRLNPNAASVFVNRANTYLRKRDIDHALADLNEAIRLKPDEPIAFGTRAAAYSAKQDYDHAIADFSESIRLKPDNTAVLIGRASAYNAKQDYPHAVADDNEALKLNPAFGPALNDRCWARAMQNQNLDDALSDCNAALKQAPTNSAILDSRGFVYFRMGKLDLAKADYDAAIAAGPRAATLYKRGIVKNRLGDAEGGKADIAAALTIDPHAGDDMNRIGVTP